MLDSHTVIHKIALKVQQTITRIDQMGRHITMPLAPKRIVSLVPSQTELLYYLGLTEEVVGQTLFCIYPDEMHKSKARVGGTKNFKLEKIQQLNPDLIIGNMEENQKEGIELLQQHYPVWMSNIKTLEQALSMITDIGELVNKSTESNKLVHAITSSFDGLIPNAINQTVLYFIWRKPWMAVGRDTFIGDMLAKTGFSNSIQEPDKRYPTLKDDDIVSLNPQVILLSSEPYPFKEQHLKELQQLCPHATIQLVDGELFSWYGSRLLHSAQYFKQLLLQLNTSK